MARPRTLPEKWTPGRITPEATPRRRPISLRVPPELYDALGQYAESVGATRSYLILECVRRMLAAHPPTRSSKDRRRKS